MPDTTQLHALTIAIGDINNNIGEIQNAVHTLLMSKHADQEHARLTVDREIELLQLIKTTARKIGN